MPKTSILGFRLFDPDETSQKIAYRFKTHLVRLRNATPAAEDALAQKELKALIRMLDDREIHKIDRRVELIMQARAKLPGTRHLKPEDRKALQTLADGAELIAIPSEHRADEIAAELHGDMPWMGPANELLWHAMRRSVREGWRGFRLPPMLLAGPPGIGKSHWARKLGELVMAPVMVLEASSEAASFGLVGSQRGWSGAEPGRLIRTILRTAVANPIIVVDEIEKAGTPMSNRSQAFGLTEATLPSLEPLSSRRWNCPYYQVEFDMSWVGWIFICNSAAVLSEPFRSRCPPIHLRHLTHVELDGFVRREGARHGLSETAIEAIADTLAHPSLRNHRPSLRIAARMVLNGLQ